MSDDIVIISGADEVQIISGAYDFNPALMYYRNLPNDEFNNLPKEEVIVLTILDFEQNLQNAIFSKPVKVDAMDLCPLLGIMDTYMILIDNISTPVSFTYLKICLDKSKEFYDQGKFYEAFKILENPYTRDFITKMRLAN